MEASDGSWKKVLGRLETLEETLMKRNQRLSEVRAFEESKRLIVVSEPPFKSLRDAISRLLFKGACASAVSPDIFVTPSNEETSEGPIAIHDVISKDGLRTLQDEETVTSLALVLGDCRPEQSLKSRCNSDTTTDWISPSKRRKLGQLSSLSIDIQQKIKGNMAQVWRAVDMACWNRVAKDVENETQQVQKALNHTMARTTSAFTMLSPESRELLRSTLRCPQSMLTGASQPVSSDLRSSAAQTPAVSSSYARSSPLGLPRLNPYDNHSASVYTQQPFHQPPSQQQATPYLSREQLFRSQQLTTNMTPLNPQHSGFIITPTVQASPSQHPFAPHHQFTQHQFAQQHQFNQLHQFIPQHPSPHTQPAISVSGSHAPSQTPTQAASTLQPGFQRHGFVQSPQTLALPQQHPHQIQNFATQTPTTALLHQQHVLQRQQLQAVRQQQEQHLHMAQKFPSSLQYQQQINTLSTAQHPSQRS